MLDLIIRGGDVVLPQGVRRCDLAIEGEVIAAGAGIKSEDGKITPLDVKAGDRILFGKWSGTEVKVDGEDLLIMKESDILGIIEGTASGSKKKVA